MTQKIKVTSKEFKGLLNPYTGEPMDVFMIVGGPGPVKYFCPNTYATSDRYPTPKAAFAAWDRTGGVGGTRSGGAVTCAYTGRPLSRMRDEDGCYFAGGFDPRVPRTREDFLHAVWMRDGKSPYPATGPAARVDGVPADRGHVGRTGRTLEATDDTLAMAAGVMERSGFSPDKKTVVNGASLPKSGKSAAPKASGKGAKSK